MVLMTLRARSRDRLGVHGNATENMLVDLRDGLRSLADIDGLPANWHAEQCIQSAFGDKFSGDLAVTSRSPDGRWLEIVLADLSGKGTSAGTRSLLLSGALGGLLGQVESDRLLCAVNSYLLRQPSDEAFATAVHLSLDLQTGRFSIGNAGHPAPVQFVAGSGRWSVLTSAGGPALGLIVGAQFPRVHGVLHKGDALVLYTDGVIETPDHDLDMGVDRMIGTAETLVRQGFVGGSRRLCRSPRRARATTGPSSCSGAADRGFGASVLGRVVALQPLLGLGRGRVHRLRNCARMPRRPCRRSARRSPSRWASAMGELCPRRPVNRAAYPRAVTDPPRVRTFHARQGRRSAVAGRRLATLLPRYAVPAAALRSADRAPVVLEVGCGFGAAALAYAAAYPGHRVVALDVHRAGVARMLVEADAAGLAEPVGRRRGCGRAFCEQDVGEGVLAAVHLFFPDPWPKTRHRRRRFVTGRHPGPARLPAVPAGHVLVATDRDEHAAYVVGQVRDHGAFRAGS